VSRRSTLATPGEGCFSEAIPGHMPRTPHDLSQSANGCYARPAPNAGMLDAGLLAVPVAVNISAWSF